MKPFVAVPFRLFEQLSGVLSSSQPIVSLLARLYVSWGFFASGLTKIGDFESTLFLFEYEYQVPYLSFTLAAYLATFGEIVFPVLLSLGLASRFSALALSVVNIVAVISLEEMPPAALNEHIIWGVILLHTVFWGASKLSVDYIVKKRTIALN